MALMVLILHPTFVKVKTTTNCFNNTQNQNQMKKQLLKRLSAFIVTAMLFSASAYAQIVYTDVDPDTTITQNPLGSTAYALDINNDGITDANLTASRTSSNKSVFLGTSNGSQALMCCVILQARAINHNVFIGSDPSGTNGSWGTGQDARLRQIPVGGGGPWGPNPIPFGDWSTPADRYLAIRFSLGGDWYYGWVRVSVVNSNPGISFTVRDYAYNSVPGEGIFAGQTACTIPFGLAVNNVDSNTVVLNWQSLSADTFNLRYRPTGTEIWSVTDTVTTNPFTFAGLTGCTEYEFQVEAVCDGLLSGYSASFIHTTDGCCSVPGLVTVGVVGATSASVSWGSVTAANSYDAQLSVNGGASWVLISDITTNFYELTGLDSCTSYQVRVRTVCNGGTTDWSTPVNFETVGCGACIDLTYCPSSGFAFEEWIARVAVGTLNNQSGGGSGWSDFTTLSTTLEIGQGHPITLEPGYLGEVYPEYFKVFVDFDQNGFFDSPGELAYNAGGLTTGPISGTLNIPAGALEGSTRMRVVMAYADPTVGGCSGFEFGETEDYCVYLVQNTTGVGESATSGLLHVFPNPFTSTLTVSMGMYKAGMVTCTLRALTGQALLTRTVAPTGGPASFTLDLGSLASGIYLLEMQVDGERIVRKVVKE
jgi:hypothetical protein